MSIQELLEVGINKLKEHNIETPIVMARRLMRFFLNQDHIYLILHSEEQVPKDKEKAYLEAIDKITNNIPIQYIIKKQEFMKMEFYVDENVLIPRADTEIVVQEAINIINDNKYQNILDICTGSGAIAISIAKYTSANKIAAVDISKKSLAIAKKNATKNEVLDKLEFINSNMFKNIKEEYDLIISNPPYIRKNDINNLDENVKKEPIIALDGGDDGLSFYRIIEKEAYNHLKENGYLVLEIGYDQKEDVTNILSEKYTDIVCKQDLAGNDRVIICRKR